MTQLDRRTGLRTRVGQTFCVRALTVAMLAAPLAACSEAGSEDAGPATVESAGAGAGTFCEAAAHLVSLLQPDQEAAPTETEAMTESVVVWFEQAERSAPANLATRSKHSPRPTAPTSTRCRDVDYDLDAIFGTPEGEQLAIDASHSLTPVVVDYFESKCGLSFGDQAQPPPTSTAGADSLEWSECVDPSLVGECATLAVPLDYADPAGPTIDLALLRRRATTTPVGVLIVNPGGPGGSGVQFASDARDVFPKRVRRDRLRSTGNLALATDRLHHRHRPGRQLATSTTPRHGRTRAVARRTRRTHVTMPRRRTRAPRRNHQRRPRHRGHPCCAR